jgi:hypothetical protein
MNQKLIIGGVLLTVWGVLVATGRTDPSDYVHMIRDIIIGLGLYHVTLTKPGE